MSWVVDINGTLTGAVKRITEELNNDQICKLEVPSTVANKALVAVDRDTTVTVNGATIFLGTLTGPAYEQGMIECKVYDKVFVTLNQTELFTADYTDTDLGTTAASTILAAILAGSGITVGECPTTSIEVRFVDTPREKAAIYIAMALGMDWWTDGVSKFYVGCKGFCQFEFKCNENAGVALYDATNNEEEGVLVNGPSWVAGKFGYGISCVSADSEYINSNVEPGTLGATGAWSFVFFVKAGVGETGCLMGLRNAATGAIFRVDWSANKIRVRLTSDAAVSIDFTGSDTVADSAFHVVEVVVDPGNDLISLYVDGVLDDSDNTAFAACTFGIIDLIWGGYNNNGVPASFTDAVFDELMFFKQGHNARQAAAFGGLSMVDAAALAPALIDKLKNDVDRAKSKNYVLVIGVDTFGNELRGEAYIDATTGKITKATPPGGFSYKPARYLEKSPSTVAELANIAASHLRTRLTDIKELQVPTRITNGYDLFTGDFVVAEDTELVLGDVYRIYQKITEVTAVTLALDKLVPGLENAILSLDQLQEIGIYPGGIGGIPKSSQSFTTDVIFSATDYNTAAWGAGTITFADGTTHVIDAGNSGNLAPGYWWVYFTWGLQALAYTQTEATAIAANKVILASLYVGGDTGQDISINTFGGAAGVVVGSVQMGESSVFAASMRQGVMPFDSTVNVTVNAGAPHTTVDITAGTITFANGDTLGITLPATFGPFADTNLRYIYFTVGSNTLQVTDNFAVAMTDSTGLLARIYCSANTSQEMGIQNIKVKFPNIITDFVGAKAIETEHLTSKEIFGKDMATQTNVGIVAGNAGIRILGDASDLVQAPTVIGDTIGGNFAAGIYGFAAGPARKFYLDPSNGRIYVWDAGSFRLHRNNAGVNQYVRSVDIGVYDLGLGGGATPTAEFVATTNMLAMITSHAQFIALDGPNDIIVIDDAWDALIPQVDGSVDLGTTVIRWGSIFGDKGDFGTRLRIPVGVDMFG